MSQQFPNLFSPYRIKSVELRNRIFSTGHDTDLGRHGAPSEVIEPPADERESFRSKIVDWRCKVQLAVKPRFHCVLIGGRNICQVVGHQRTEMIGHNFLRDHLLS